MQYSIPSEEEESMAHSIGVDGVTTVPRRTTGPHTVVQDLPGGMIVPEIVAVISEA